MLGQQSKNQPNKFTSCKRECTFMLMSFYLIVLFLVKCGKFTAMVLYMANCFNQIISEICVSSLWKPGILGNKLAGLVFTPDKTSIFGKGILRFKCLDVTNFSKSDPPVLAINSLRTESEQDEHDGFRSLILGIIQIFRNPLAYETKISCYLPKEDNTD